MVRIDLLTDRHNDAYAAFLKGVDDSLLYYSLKYKAFLEDLLRCRPQYWIVLEGDEVVGVLPLMEKDGPWGKVINSLPFYGSNGGILAGTQTACELLARKFEAVASQSDVLSSTLIEHPLHAIPDSIVRYDLLDERIGQLTSLEGLAKSPESIHLLTDSTARRNIRKAERAGVEVRVDNDAVEFLRNVHTENMLAIGGKAKSTRFFETFPKYFLAGKDYDIYVAQRDGKATAALLLFYFNRTVEYYTPVVVSEQREYQSTALILRTAMIDAARHGFLYWNWGGTWRSQDGVWRFKRKWGGKDHRYRYFVRVNRSKVFTKKPKDIMRAYPDFYVVPFDQLRTEDS